MQLRSLKHSLLLIVLIILLALSFGQKRGGRRRGKGKNLLPFLGAIPYSLVGGTGDGDPRAAQLVKTSHFMFYFMLGGKIWLICASEGEPRPAIVWYKDGSELIFKPGMHIYERLYSVNQTWSKIEIDPGTVGDSGIYTCYTSNQHGTMFKNFKVEPNL